jgi:hypothetical protein
MTPTSQIYGTARSFLREQWPEIVRLSTALGLLGLLGNLVLAAWDFSVGSRSWGYRVVQMTTGLTLAAWNLALSTHAYHCARGLPSTGVQALAAAKRSFLAFLFTIALPALLVVPIALVVLVFLMISGGNTAALLASPTTVVVLTVCYWVLVYLLFFLAPHGIASGIWGVANIVASSKLAWSNPRVVLPLLIPVLAAWAFNLGLRQLPSPSALLATSTVTWFATLAVGLLSVQAYCTLTPLGPSSTRPVGDEPHRT